MLLLKNTDIFHIKIEHDFEKRFDVYNDKINSRIEDTNQNTNEAVVARCSSIHVLKNVANFTGKHLCWSFFIIKLQAFRTPPVAASE